MAHLCSAGTLEYDVDIGKLAIRRLRAEYPEEKGLAQRLEAGKRNVCFTLYREGDLERWCRALEMILLGDLAHFELAAGRFFTYEDDEEWWKCGFISNGTAMGHNSTDTSDLWNGSPLFPYQTDRVCRKESYQP